jgi:Ca-activated chloride channel family protein
MIRFTSLLPFRGPAPIALACAFLLAVSASFSGAQSTAAPTPPATGQTPPAGQGSAQAPGQAQPQVQTTQPGQEQNQSGQYTIPVEVNEVNLIFSVTDKHGRFVKDLKQSDFALLDDHKAPAQVYSFAQQTNLPLRVGILIDTSTSIRRRFEFEQQATNEFLLEVLHPRTDRGFVMGFDVQPDLKQDWTSNLDLLNTGISALRPGGGTALYDALYTACRDKMLTSARGQEPLHKALILISDGDDNQSRAYLDDAIKMCQRAETMVYAISTNTSPTRERGDDVLKQIADATGGRAFFPQRLEDMSNQFKEIQDELRSQYNLVYKPADFKMDGAFRPIYLFCLDRRYVVRAKKGYFAPRP